MVVDIYNGILAKKNNEIFPFAVVWMDLEGIVLKWGKKGVVYINKWLLFLLIKFWDDCYTVEVN